MVPFGRRHDSCAVVGVHPGIRTEVLPVEYPWAHSTPRRGGGAVKGAMAATVKLRKYKTLVVIA